LGANRERIPVVVNAKLLADQTVVWSVSSAKNRDILFDELVIARSSLEEKTQQLEVLASVDELTGLLNRRACNKAAKEIFAQSEHDGKPVSVGIIDIDDFKKVNDTYGHTFGDDVLRNFGQCLKEVCRANETVARFGGEEFIFVLDGADTDEAVVLCDRIHAHLRTCMKDTRPVTVSIGLVTRFGKFGPDFDELLGQADDALYQAKADGKNRTVVGRSIRQKVSCGAK